MNLSEVFLVFSVGALVLRPKELKTLARLAAKLSKRYQYLRMQWDSALKKFQDEALLEENQKKAQQGDEVYKKRNETSVGL